MILNQEIFGSLTIPTSEERILCLNATESAIREQTFLHLAAFYGHLDILISFAFNKFYSITYGKDFFSLTI